MNRLDTAVARDRENPDPTELDRPVPKAYIALVMGLLGWAIYYLATH